MRKLIQSLRFFFIEEISYYIVNPIDNGFACGISRILKKTSETVTLFTEVMNVTGWNKGIINFKVMISRKLLSILNMRVQQVNSSMNILSIVNIEKLILRFAR